MTHTVAPRGRSPPSRMTSPPSFWFPRNKLNDKHCSSSSGKSHFDSFYCRCFALTASQTVLCIHPQPNRMPDQVSPSCPTSLKPMTLCECFIHSAIAHKTLIKLNNEALLIKYKSMSCYRIARFIHKCFWHHISACGLSFGRHKLFP